MRVLPIMNRFLKFTILLLIVFSISLAAGCSKKPEHNSNTPTPYPTQEEVNNEVAEYFDVDTINGSFNTTGDTAVTWQKGGLIRSEVKVFMDTVHWASDIISTATMTNTSDLDGDGQDEQIEIQSDPETGALSVILFMNDKAVNLFGLVSEEFLEAVKEMPGGYDDSNIPIYIDAACIDLDGDDYKEILLAVGNDNGALVVSLLKYTDGELIYKEAGGIKGTIGLRYIIITVENTLFAELYSMDPQTSEALPISYIEYSYDGRELVPVRYGDISETPGSIDEEPNHNDESFTEYARIKTWYSSGGFSSETAWVHFKAVDAEGITIMEVLGSDEMNMRKEQDALAETTKRRELVDQLREDMTSAGWTELGVADGGEWYEYIFGW